MKIEKRQVVMLDVIDAPKLDRIKIIAEDFGPGQGQLTIVCWGRAWSAYWGGMGSADITQFCISMSAEYIAENLVRGQIEGLKRNQKHEMRYLMRIVEAAKEAMRVQLRIDLHGEAA